MAGLGIICGMEAEAAALGPWREDIEVSVRISGARPDRAEEQALDLIEKGATALLSWGIAGALAPGLQSGQVLRPSIVLAPGGLRYEVGLEPGSDGILVGMDHLVRTPAEKKGLRAASNAISVDMESHRVAKVAHLRKVPFGVIRVVSDPAERYLPKIAENALNEQGRPKIGAVLWSILGRPSDLPMLLQAGQDSKRALKVLGCVAAKHLPRLLERAGDPRSILPQSS
jgi:adenosylhomocysteine nucleosidase